MKRRLVLLIGIGLLSACAKQAAPEVKVPAAPAPLDQGFRSQVPNPAPALPVVRPVAESVQLGNTFSVWVMPKDSGTLSLRVSCRIGARDNPQGKSGLAALTARMLTEGTEQKSALELAVASESLGATLHEGSDRNASSVELEVLPGDEEAAVALLAEVVRHPSFLEKDLVRVRSEWLDDLASQRDDPALLAWLVGYRALLGPRLGIPPNGTPSDVRDISSKDLRSFWAANWTPERCALLAVGPTSANSLEGIASSYFGSWKPGKGESGRTPAPLAAPARTTLYVFDRPDAVQTALFVAGTAPPLHAPGHEAREVLNGLFGGLFTSRLNQNLRERNAYTYGAFSTFVGTRDWGLWAAATSVRTDVTVPALSELLAEWQGLLRQGTIKEDEIARSRSDLIYKTSAHLEHTSSLLEELEEIFVNELEADYFGKLPETLAHTGAAEIGKELQYVPTQGAVIAVVGDQSKMGDLTSFAEQRRSVGLQWLDGGD